MGQVSRMRNCFLGLCLIVAFSIISFLSTSMMRFLIPRANSFYEAYPSKSFKDVEEYINVTRLKIGLKPLENSRPIQPGFGPVINDVSSFRYLANAPPCDEDQQIFVAVISAPGYIEKRQSIRDTWARLNSSIRVAFVLGLTDNAPIQQETEKEAETYGDIIQTDIMENPNNLTLKTVALLGWLNTYCPKISYVLKCDDDVYVNFHNFGILLNHLRAPEKLAIYGMQNPTRTVVRNYLKKWYVTFEEWPYQTYPRYLAGRCLLILGQALEPLLAAAQVTPYLWVDDVYLTGLLAKKAQVKVYSANDRMFVMQSKNGWKDPCFIKETFAWMTGSPDQMQSSHLATEDFYQNRTKCEVTFRFTRI